MNDFTGLRHDPEWKSFLTRWLLLSLFFHGLASVFSIGHQAADEFFQILEFMSFKLGKTPSQSLSIEYFEKMRPWLQPAIYAPVVKLLNFIGISNPFNWAIVLRFLSGFVGWLSLWGLALC